MSVDTRASTHTHTAWDSNGVRWYGDVCYASAVRCSPDALGCQPLSLWAWALSREQDQTPSTTRRFRPLEGKKELEFAEVF